MAPALVVEGLVKRYEERAVVRDVSFTVERGELFGIIGSDGAGKTTTLECVQGLRVADEGHIAVAGVDAVADPAAVRHVAGTQLQDASLPDRMRVKEAIALFASMRDGSIDTGAVLERWGLAGVRRATFGSLSSAERLRLFVALAVLHDPEIVFFDELTTGLDVATRAAAWDLIEEVRDSGFTVVAVTQFMDEAERCDRVAVFSHGSVAALDTPIELIRRHGGGVRFWFLRPDIDTNWIQIVPGVATYVANGRTVEVRGSAESLSHVCAGLVGRGVTAEGLRVEQRGLDAVIETLTQVGVQS